jgi:hypothetical protein
MVMIEPGSQHNPEGWAQDIPAPMRTPSLEARQVRAVSPYLELTPVQGMYTGKLWEL